MLLGFASSSCSFAALSATRSLYTKGASLTSALAFMFASTNLAIEVAALALIFLGWPYAIALFVGAPVLVTVMNVLVRITAPARLADDARAHAQEAEAHEMDPSAGLPSEMRDRLRDRRAWAHVGDAYVAEWRMVWKELLVGFTVAGAIAALVPDSFFGIIFPRGDGFWVLPLQTVLAPVLAVMTFIGSMGNGPLDAVLAEHGVVFGALMAFLYADFVVPPALKINARYYGWRFSGYLAVIFTISAIVAGLIVHDIFAGLAIIPSGARSVEELSAFRLDYTLVLNVVALAVAAVLLAIRTRAKHESAAQRTAT